MNVHLLKQIFVELAETLVKAEENSSALAPGPITETLLIRGGLVLSGEVADFYSDRLTQMISITGKDGPWNESSIEKLLLPKLEQLLLSDADFKGLVKKLSSKFAEEVSKLPQVWAVSLAVFGLSVELAGTTFGNIRFRRESWKIPGDMSGIAIKDGEAELLTAEIEVLAGDENIARERAQSVLDRHLNILNALLSDGVKSHVRLRRNWSLPHEYCFVSANPLLTPPMDDTRRRHWSLVRRELSKADFNKMFLAPGGQKISCLLQSSNTFSDRVLSAFEIAGAACTSTNPYVAFLLFAVALESVLMGKQNHTEITYQVALRGAVLASKYRQKRERFVKRMKLLYAIRSRIVHSGETLITEEELQSIRFNCLYVLHSIISEPVFESFTKAEELDQWFSNQALGGIEQSDESAEV